MIKHSLSALGLFALMSLHANAAQDKAEAAFSDELIQCAAYYQISSAAITAMNAPQMQDVGERLASSAIESVTLAKQYATEAEVAAKLETAKAEQVSRMSNASDLAALMGQYKDKCKTLIAEPQKRLDYWYMATM
jgi:xanthine dehydrogenase iron-sulfur cluster and FAD-binding subunit A